MRLPSSAVVALVLVIPLAGCSGFFGPTQPPSLAPGVTTERVDDASLLEDANRDVLRNSSYTYVRNYTQRIDADGYHYAVDHDTRAYVAANGAFLYHHRGVVDSGDRSSVYVDGLWANGTVAVARTVNVANESVTYTCYRPPEPYSAANATRADVAAALGGASVTTTWNESDTGYVRVRATESQTRRWQASNGTVVNATTTRNATATVRGDGFVPSLNASVFGLRPLPVGASNSDASSDGSLARFRDSSRVRYTSLGSTRVPRPDWIDTALEATDGLPFGQTTAPRATDGSR